MMWEINRLIICKARYLYFNAGQLSVESNKAISLVLVFLGFKSQDSRFSLFAFLVNRLIITNVSMHGEVTSRNHQAYS